MSFDKGRERADELKAEEAASVATFERAKASDQMTMFLELQTRMLALQEQQAAALGIQVERTAPRDHPNYHNKSIFNPEGLTEAQLPQLKCDIFLGPFKFNRTPLLIEEIVALNRLGPITDAWLTKLDGSKQKATVVATKDDRDRLTKLEIVTNLRKDSAPQFMPNVVSLATQLADQYEASMAVATP